MKRKFVCIVVTALISLSLLPNRGIDFDEVQAQVGPTDVWVMMAIMR